MTEITNELMYEVLKALRGDMADLRRDQKETRAQLQSFREYVHGQMQFLQAGLSALQVDVLRVERNLAGFQDRLDRIETRLGLHDGPALHT
jgi:hypothetical protein